MGVHTSKEDVDMYTQVGEETEKTIARENQLLIQLPDRTVPIPDEVVIQFLSFLPVKDLKNCSKVSCVFRRLINSQTLWKLKCTREGKYLEDMMAAFYPSDWRKFYLKQPFSRNLIKNSSGQEDFKHWTKLLDGGNLWIVEKEKGHGSGAKPEELLAIADGKQCNFATSYDWCQKCQLIDLLEEGFEENMLDELQPPFKVGEWYAARFDCGNIYKLHVELMKASKNTKDESIIIDSFSFEPLPTPQWAPNDWREVTHVFKRYGPGLRFIRFTHQSKDTQFWAGHYGSKMAGSYVRVSFENSTES